MVDFAERVYGITLMPWQVKVITDQLSYGPDGRLLFSSALTSTARQQGKSVTLKVLASWWAIGMATHRKEPQSVVLVANEYERVALMFREMEPILTEKFGAKAFRSYGRESLTFPDGSPIRLQAATDGKHGYSIDYLLLDEIWQIKPSVIYQAFRPAMIARRDSQMSCWSTAGDSGSVVLQQMRTAGLQAIDSGVTGRAYFCEFSPPAGVDPADRRWWPAANPALGITVDMAALEDAWTSIPRAEFVRAHLNMWQGANDSWLPPDVWDKLATDATVPAGGYLAVDSSLDENRIVGIRAVRVGLEVLVTVAFICDRQADMWTHIARELDGTDTQLLITPGYESLVPADYRRRTEIVGYRELKTMTPIVRRAILDGQIRHTGEITLAEHINQAVMVKTSDGAPLSAQKSPGPIELARCAV
ncbi:MAG: terminase TerL endonuclease subunit, partial [Ilumatobacteraceae bacterium]